MAPVGYNLSQSGTPKKNFVTPNNVATRFIIPYGKNLNGLLVPSTCMEFTKNSDDATLTIYTRTYIQNSAIIQ